MLKCPACHQRVLGSDLVTGVCSHCGQNLAGTGGSSWQFQKKSGEPTSDTIDPFTVSGAAAGEPAPGRSDQTIVSDEISESKQESLREAARSEQKKAVAEASRATKAEVLAVADRATSAEKVALDEKEKAVAATEQEKKAKVLALAAEKEAVKQRETADKQRQIAVNERLKAEASQKLEEQAKLAAVEAAKPEEKAKVAAIASEKVAVAEREKAVLAKQQEEYEAYLSKIGLAASQIDKNAFDAAREVLTTCKPELRNWEWGRLMHLCSQSERAFDAQSPLSPRRQSRREPLRHGRLEWTGQNLRSPVRTSPPHSQARRRLCERRRLLTRWAIPGDR